MNVHSIDQALQTYAQYAVPAIMLIAGSLSWTAAVSVPGKVFGYLVGSSSVLLATVGTWLLFVALLPGSASVPPTAVVGLVVICTAIGVWVFAGMRHPAGFHQQAAHA